MCRANAPTCKNFDTKIRNDKNEVIELCTNKIGHYEIIENCLHNNERDKMKDFGKCNNGVAIFAVTKSGRYCGICQQKIDDEKDQREKEAKKREDQKKKDMEAARARQQTEYSAATRKAKTAPGTAVKPSPGSGGNTTATRGLKATQAAKSGAARNNTASKGSKSVQGVRPTLGGNNTTGKSPKPARGGKRK